MNSNRPNVLFINLPSIPMAEVEAALTERNFRVQPYSMPLGILYLSSYTNKHNELGRVGILDYALAVRDIANYGSVEDFIAGVARADCDFTPDVLAFSLVFSTAHPFFLLSLSLLKTIWPEAVTVVGGTHATNSVGHLLEKSEVDYVVRGEGEVPFSQFLSQYSQGEPINVRGIYSRGDLPLPDAMELGEYIIDLDQIPFPNWDLIDMEAYTHAIGRQRNLGTDLPIGTLMTTRGCPFRCTYCASHTVHGRTVRYRTVENVMDEARLLNSKYGVKLFIPEDDLLTADRERTLHLLRSFRDLGIPGMEVQTPDALSVNTMDEEIIDEMARSGIRIAVFAVESGSDYVQKNIIRKNCSLPKAIRLVKYAQSKGMITRCYFVIGFPGETQEQMRETVEFAKTLGADWSVFMIATPLVGSEMNEQFVKMGVIQNDIDLWAEACYEARRFDTPEISAEGLNDFVYRANLECNFLHNPNKVRGEFETALKLYKDIVWRYPFHVVGWYCIMDCYKGLGNEGEARRTEEHLRSLIESDERAAEMYAKYADLMPGFAAAQLAA